MPLANSVVEVTARLLSSKANTLMHLGLRAGMKRKYVKWPRSNAIKEAVTSILFPH